MFIHMFHISPSKPQNFHINGLMQRRHETAAVVRRELGNFCASLASTDEWRNIDLRHISAYRVCVTWAVQ